MKKLFLLSLLFLLCAFEAKATDFQNVSQQYGNVFESIPITGTAGDDYPAVGSAAVWADCRQFTSKTILIENTDSADSLTYVIRVKFTWTGTYKDYPGEVDIVVPVADGSDYSIVNIPDHAASIAIFPKNTVGGSNADYKITVGGTR